MKKVTVYYSSVPGSVKIRGDQTRVQDLLEAKKIPFELIDVAADEEAKNYMQSKSEKKILPQIFVDGEFKGFCAQLDDANEDGQLETWLLQ